MENVSMTLFLLSLLAIIVFVILFLVKLISNKGLAKKLIGILLGASVAVLFISFILFPSSNGVTKVSSDKIDEIDSTPSEEKELEDDKTKDESRDDIGTRKSPLSKGEPVNIKFKTVAYGKVDIDIELIDTLYGEEANDLILKGNQFNDIADDGKEYILGKFRIKANNVEKEPLSITNHLFSAVSEDGKSYEDFITIAGLDPEIRADLYEGAEHEGFAYFLVDSGDNPLGVFNRGNDSEVWFSLR